MKIEITTERLGKFGPVRLTILHDDKLAGVWVDLKDDEAEELAGALRSCVQAERTYGESMEVRTG